MSSKPNMIYMYSWTMNHEGVILKKKMHIIILMVTKERHSKHTDSERHFCGRSGCVSVPSWLLSICYRCNKDGVSTFLSAPTATWVSQSWIMHIRPLRARCHLLSSKSGRLVRKWNGSSYCRAQCESVRWADYRRAPGVLYMVIVTN